MSSYQALIDEYAAGPQQLRDAVYGMTDEQLRATPVPGKWSTLQVVCHVADFELVYSDRIKRAIAEEQPLVASGDPDLFAEHLAYEQRDVAEELHLIEAVRAHLARILRSVPEEAFQRTVRHSSDGLLTVEELLRRITGHIPHHVKFIAQKRQALGI